MKALIVAPISLMEIIMHALQMPIIMLWQVNESCSLTRLSASFDYSANPMYGW